MNTFVFHSLLRNITHLAIITSKTIEKGNFEVCVVREGGGGGGGGVELCSIRII